MFFAVLLASPVQAAEWTGKVRVVDGNTLVVGETQVRLFGSQAPHLDQTCRTRKGQVQHCGQLARQTLAILLRGIEVRCVSKGLDEQGRALAQCFAAWMDVGEEMIASGWALADPKTGAAYKRAEIFAKARYEGLWRTTFTRPWMWQGVGD